MIDNSAEAYAASGNASLFVEWDFEVLFGCELRCFEIHQGCGTPFALNEDHAPGPPKNLNLEAPFAPGLSTLSLEVLEAWRE